MYNYLLLLKYILLLQSTIVRNRNENDQFVQFFFHRYAYTIEWQFNYSVEQWYHKLVDEWTQCPPFWIKSIANRLPIDCQ